MKKVIFTVLFLSAFIAFPSHNITLKENRNNSRFASDHIIIKLKKSSTNHAASVPNTSLYEQTINEIFSTGNIKLKKIKTLFPRDSKRNTALYNRYELETYHVVYFDGNTDILGMCTELKDDKRIDFSEPDFIGEAAGVKGTSMTPNDNFFSRQWGLRNDGLLGTTTGRKGKTGADMNVLKAWDIETGSSDIIVGIMDSGTKIDHPDLNGRIWVNTEEVKNGRDDDGNGFVDDINGYNFAYDNPNVKDDGGHGTNIAGTIGATTNNDIGYAGIDQKCKLMICIPGGQHHFIMHQITVLVF